MHQYCNPSEIAVTSMTSQDKKSQSVAVPVVLFVLSILPAIVLLITAFTIWLATLFDSAILACIVVGCAFLLIATALYFVSLRSAVKRVQDRLETIYETSRVVQSGLDWINEKIDKYWS